MYRGFSDARLLFRKIRSPRCRSNRYRSINNRMVHFIHGSYACPTTPGQRHTHRPRSAGLYILAPLYRAHARRTLHPRRDGLSEPATQHNQRAHSNVGDTRKRTVTPKASHVVSYPSSHGCLPNLGPSHPNWEGTRVRMGMRLPRMELNQTLYNLTCSGMKMFIVGTLWRPYKMLNKY